MLRIGPQLGKNNQKVRDAGVDEETGNPDEDEDKAGSLWNMEYGRGDIWRNRSTGEGGCSNREDRGSPVKHEQPRPDRTLGRDGWHQW